MSQRIRLRDLFIRGVSTAACLVFLFSPFRVGALAAGSLGDNNQDGQVGAADAAVLLRCLETFSSGSVETADVSRNGSIDQTDARILLNYACGAIPELNGFGEKLQDGLCDESFFDRFSYTGVKQLPGSYYKDNQVSVVISKVEYEKVVEGKHRRITCYVAEIYIQDILSFRTAMSSNAFHAKRQLVLDMAQEHNALIAISGDFYDASQHKGPVNRNGEWYRTEIGDANDLAVLLYDGTLLTLPAGTYSEESIVEMNPYQVWCFGPLLINKDGTAPIEYNSSIRGEHPRSALGSDGPGHYFFVLADGRRPQYSSGLNYPGLTELFLQLGCTSAYNLDGGRTAVMATKDMLISVPIELQRPVSDILYIAAPID